VCHEHFVGDEVCHIVKKVENHCSRSIIDTYILNDIHFFLHPHAFCQFYVKRQKVTFKMFILSKVLRLD
jgi:hypothetical protein